MLFVMIHQYRIILILFPGFKAKCLLNAVFSVVLNGPYTQTSNGWNRCGMEMRLLLWPLSLAYVIESTEMSRAWFGYPLIML